jgi:hypothetical protein
MRQLSFDWSERRAIMRADKDGNAIVLRQHQDRESEKQILH